MRCCEQIRKEFKRLQREKANSIDYAVICSIYSTFYLDTYTLDIIPKRIFKNFIEHLKIYKKLYDLQLKYKRGY